jgi:hypothetical protein
MIEDGRLPVANETASYEHSIKTLGQGRLRRYPPKEANFDTLIERGVLEDVAEERGWKLPGKSRDTR